MKIQIYKKIRSYLKGTLAFSSILTITACSTMGHIFNTSENNNQPKLEVKASPSQNPVDQLKISGTIEIEALSSNSLPYRAVNYRIQLLDHQQTDVINEVHTNSNGEFSFTVDKDIRYFLKIMSNQNKRLDKLHGPFSAGDAISIKITSHGL
jgi:hypothetical protein